ncbi:hypothetical protein EON65_13190 [archaeon]|nr:MAG: hypothetical protein EON65_13190 [archaeon]
MLSIFTYTINPTPTSYTIHHTPYTIHHAPYPISHIGKALLENPRLFTKQDDCVFHHHNLKSQSYLARVFAELVEKYGMGMGRGDEDDVTRRRVKADILRRHLFKMLYR